MPKPRSAKPDAAATGRASKKNTQHRDRTAILASKSTATEAQRERIIAALRRRPQTSYDLRRLGCYQSAVRVKELRDRFGYVIDTQRVTLVDRDGWWHPRAALYVLRSEPEGAA